MQPTHLERTSKGTKYRGKVVWVGLFAAEQTALEEKSFECVDMCVT